MKMLDRYVLRQFWVSVLVSFCFFVSLYVVVHLFSHLEDMDGAREAFGARGLSLFTGMCRYYALNIPFRIVELGPFGVLMAAMWTVQRMAREQELVAAQVSGVSLHRVTAPILCAAFLLSAGLTAVKHEALPRLAVETHEMERMMKGKPRATIQGPLIVRDGNDARISIQSYEPATRIARGVEIRSEELALIAELEAMRFDSDGPEGEGWYRPASAGRVNTDLKPGDIEIDSRALRFLGGDQLDGLLKKMPGRLDLQILRQTRFTYPFTTLVLLLLGLPAVLRRENQNAYAAAGLCLLVSVLYFGFENVIRGLAERDALLSPTLAAWLPIVIFGIPGALAYHDL
jgi:lipopolysaccharide export system permease protein